MIVLASGGMIKKVVDKRSANYSDRLDSYARGLYENTHILPRGYDASWRIDRRLYHMNLNVNTVHRYVPYLSVETLQLCIDLLDDSENFFDHIKRMSSSVASSLSYGFRIDSADSPVMNHMFKYNAFFLVIISRSKFLDWYPGLRPLFRFLPIRLRPLARQAAKHLSDEKEHFSKLYDEAVSKDMPSFSKDIAAAQTAWKETPNGELLDHQAAAYTAGSAFEAGSDTTKNTITGFMQAMALFPEVVAEAHYELDSIIGEDRLPTIDDIPSLPYIRGIVKETLRWMPTAISGAAPHAATLDDKIDGYDIPAGAGVLLAVWTVNMDPELFPDPRRFEPRRHNVGLSAGEAAQASNVHDRDHWTFGAGRRICPGLHLAEKTLLLAFARILWAFDISKARDEHGNEIEIDPYAITTQSIAACPLPFR